MKFGTVPEWIAAVSTFLGFGFGLVLLRRQLNAMREAETERLVEYARRVSVAAWTVPENGTLAVNVTNHAPGPIFDCDIRVLGDTGRVLRNYVYQVIAPTGQYKGDTSVGEEPSGAEMDFTDPNGTRWTLI